MKDIVFSIDLFANEQERRWGERILRLFLMALYEIDCEEYLANPLWPDLYAAQLRYEREPNTEVWKDIHRLYLDGVGDCEDLGTGEASNLSARYCTPAIPDMTSKVIDGMYLYHIRSRVTTWDEILRLGVSPQLVKRMNRGPRLISPYYGRILKPGEILDPSRVLGMGGTFS